MIISSDEKKMTASTIGFLFQFVFRGMIMFNIFRYSGSILLQAALMSIVFSKAVAEVFKKVLTLKPLYTLSLGNINNDL